VAINPSARPIYFLFNDASLVLLPALAIPQPYIKPLPRGFFFEALPHKFKNQLMRFKVILTHA
jgi:hypothetical protein